MEDAFQRMKRLLSKGTENKIITVERLFHKMTKATVSTFPDVGQVSVDSEKMTSTSGCNRLEARAGVKARLYRGSLAKAAYTVDSTGHWLPKPITGKHKTCRAAAFSQQVGLEECLLKCEILPLGGQVGRADAAQGAVQPKFFKDVKFLTKSWAGGLVRTVSATAVTLQHPAVLADEKAGSI